MKSQRQKVREQRARQRTITRITWGIIGGVILIGLGYVFWIAVRPAAGQSIPVMADTGHVEEGTDPGPFNSDPPTSGRHYANEFEAGFYDDTSLEAQSPYPEGYLVHNLEHGYVIFWYNCQLLDEQGCQDLKTQIKDVIDEQDNFKVIAFPRDTIDVPVVVTSWGQMQTFEQFDPERANAFVVSNRNKAPEPEAP